jgi:ATP-dependent Clp protease ATP-binding subunit ClpA
MFERFTGKARAVIQLSLDEAKRTDARYVGTEHLLIGMLAIGEGKAFEALNAAGITLDRARSEGARLAGHPGGPLGDDDAAALKTIGIDLEAVVSSVEESFGPGALSAADTGGRSHWGRTPFGPQAKKVLSLALQEALRLKHNYIGTEHLLLGLIRDGDGLGAHIMTGEGASLTDLRRWIEADLGKAA